MNFGVSVTNQRLKENRERRNKIPTDRICILCQLEKRNSKQWCILTFKTSENAICKACYEHIRIDYFGGNVKNCRDFFKLCEYSMLKEGLQHVRN